MWIIFKFINLYRNKTYTCKNLVLTSINTQSTIQNICKPKQAFRKQQKDRNNVLVMRRFVKLFQAVSSVID